MNGALKLMYASVFILLVACELRSEEPDTGLVYVNHVAEYHNTFVLGPKGQVSGCRYKIELGGQVSDVQLDRLTYVRDVEFADGRDEAPAIVRGWLYKGFDKTGNSWELIFGKEQNTRPGTYPVYYRFPGNANFTRWKTVGGTQRKAIDFDSQVLSILWANQVEVDQLALHPFDSRETNPLVPTLIWTALAPELNRFLEPQGAELTARLIKLQNGNLQFDLHVRSKSEVGKNVQARLFQILKNTDDVELITQTVHEALTVTASQISDNFFENGRIQLSRVATSMQETMERDAPVLAQLNAGTSRKILDNSCEVLSGKWILLSRGNAHSYFWKIKLKFEVLNATPQTYKISSLVDIGQCSTDQIDLGQSRISPLILEMENFAAFKNTGLVDPSSSPSTSVVTVSREVIQSNPDNVQIIPPTLEGTGLNMLFDECYTTFLKKLAK